VSDLRMKIVRGWVDIPSEAMYGTLSVEDREYVTCERMWNNNRPGESAVPPGFYVLEPHNGTKYQATFALIGETVSHQHSPDVIRSACVIHWEDDGRHLQGCISIGTHFSRYADGTSKLYGNAVDEVLAILCRYDQVYLTIGES